jgi:aconitase B
MAQLESLKNQLFILRRLNENGILFYGGKEKVQERISEVEQEIENFDGEEPDEDESYRQNMEVEKERRAICHSQGLWY